jgi:hypothetical protein
MRVINLDIDRDVRELPQSQRIGANHSSVVHRVGRI